MRVLQIGADRSKRGILVPGSPAYARQLAYAAELGALDIIGFSLKRDGFTPATDGQLRTHPTNSRARLLFFSDAITLATKLPWPDVVSVQDPFETGLTGLLIARALSVPLHVQVHTDFLAPAYARLSFINRARVTIAGYVLRRAARVRVVSVRIKTSIERRYHVRAPITVLPIYVDFSEGAHAMVPAELAEKFAAFEQTLLCVGRLEKEKNVALAIDAFAAAAPNSACLVIVGTGRERRALEQRARALGVHQRVFFEGEVAAAPYFALADLVLVPSHYEGYGLVIIEALAARKPVLSTDVGVAREAGAIVTDAAHFSDALKKWFTEGLRTATLKSYPYASFDEYVRAYCDDIRACKIKD